jgi:hypothetical protein
MGTMEAGRAFPFEQRLPALIRAYRDAQRDIARQVREALLAGQLDRAAERQRQLFAVVALLDELGQDTDPKVRKLIADAFEEAGDLTSTQIVRIGVDPPSSLSFGGVNREAVLTMQDAILGRLAEGRRTVGRRIEDLFARAGRRQTVMSLLGATGSRRAASRGLVEQLRERGVKAFVDRAGREWALDTYAEMHMRTVTREAVVEAAKIRMAAAGVNVARVSSSGNPCSICAPWQGVLVSLDGSTRAMGSVPVADLGALPNGGPPFHPRCRHTLMPEVALIENIKREMGAA